MFNSLTTRQSDTAIQDIPVGEIGAADEDLLEVAPYVKALAQFASSCATPMTIAVQGDWGSGKTSLMNMVRTSLESGPVRIETRWFNTWQFSQFKMGEDIATTMLLGFLYELGDDNQKARSALKNVGRFALRSASQAAKAVADITTGGAGDWAKELIDKLAQNPGDTARQLRNLKNEIVEAVDSVLKRQGADRLVVFVDDLDRVVPERAIELLETIKMFMDVPGVVFVLALDYAVVKRGLKKKFDTDENDLGGRSFFDKIIQLPFTMPTANYQIGGYLKKLLQQVNFEFGDEDIEVYEDLIRHSIGFNPRSAKRLVNVMKIYRLVESAKTKPKAKADVNADPVEQVHLDEPRYRNRVLFGLVCLQTAYEPVFHYLRANLSADVLNELRSGDLSKAEEAYRDGGISGHFDHVNKRMKRFLASLFEAVDRNHDGKLDERETTALRGVMESLAITSVSDSQPANVECNYFPLGKMSVFAVLDLEDERKADILRDIGWYADKTIPAVKKYLQNANRNSSVESVVTGYADFGRVESLGGLTVSVVRAESLYSVIAKALKGAADAEQIRSALKGAQGNTLIRNALKDVWPK